MKAIIGKIASDIAIFFSLLGDKKNTVNKIIFKITAIITVVNLLNLSKEVVNTIIVLRDWIEE